jgi:hypothetical protein
VVAPASGLAIVDIPYALVRRYQRAVQPMLAHAAELAEEARRRPPRYLVVMLAPAH